MEKMKFIKEGYIKHQKKKKKTIVALSIIVTITLFFLIIEHIKKQIDKDLEEELNEIQTQNIDNPSNKKDHIRPKKREKTVTEIVSEVKKSIVLIHTFDDEDNPIAQGSGFFIEKDKIITNRHLLRGAHKVKIKSHSKEFYAINVLADNRDCDLIILSVPFDVADTNPPPLNHSFPKVGEKIIVIGNPLGLEATVSDGIVSAFRELKPLGKIIQITSPISPGSSGSPVFNLYGEVIGVASFQIYQGQNLNFAIPISKIKELTTPEDDDIFSLNFVDPKLVESEKDPFKTGLDFFEKKDYENAMTYFKLALKQNPYNAEICYYLGMCYKENNTNKAITEFLNAIEIDPEYLDAYYMLGITYMESKQYHEASRYFEKVLNLNPEHQETLFHLGVIYTILNRSKWAIELLQKVYDAESNNQIQYYIGLNYVNMKKYNQAEIIFTNIILKDTHFFQAYLGLGYVYIATEKWKVGISQLSSIVYLDPNNEEIHFLLGLLYVGNNDLESAKKELEKLRKINSDSVFCRKLMWTIPRY
jgi:tetratricopeptide (TPR) repeat protein